MTCDYTAATDWMEFQPTLDCFRGFCESMEIDNKWLLSSAETICRPMLYNCTESTLRGIPMGLPMTKQLLTICNGSILSRGDIANRCKNNSLGDDSVAEGSLEYCEETIAVMKRFGFKPNEK